VGKLHDAGLLDVYKLAKATPDDVRKCINKTGLHFRCDTLIKMAKEIVDNHNGIVPCDFEVLTKMKNVKRKSAMLLLTEVYGQFLGITSDVHVRMAALIYEYMRSQEGAKQVDAEIAESAMRMWMFQRHFPRANKIYGSFAQLFTNTLRNPTKDKAEIINAVFEAMDEVLWNQKQITMLWSAIRACRTGYQKKRVENARKKRERVEKLKKKEEQARKKARLEQSEMEQEELERERKREQEEVEAMVRWATQEEEKLEQEEREKKEKEVDSWEEETKQEEEEEEDQDYSEGYGTQEE
jgi:endonuclease III